MFNIVIIIPQLTRNHLRNKMVFNAFVDYYFITIPSGIIDGNQIDSNQYLFCLLFLVRLLVLSFGLSDDRITYSAPTSFARKKCIA